MVSGGLHMADENHATQTNPSDATSTAAPITVPDGELSDDDLSNVAGGTGAATQMSDIEKSRHDTATSTIQNMK
jgi:hypothetical protein